MKKILYLVIVLLLAIVFISCNGTTTSPTSSITSTTSGGSTTTQSTSSTITSTQDYDLSMSLNPGVDTVEVGSEFIDAGAIAFYLDTPLTVRVKTSTLDMDTVGLYYIVYEATHEDKVIELVRVVVVIDTTPPEVSLNLGIDTVKVGTEWIDAGVIANDNYSEEVSVTVLGEVDIDTVGTYVITYLVYDELGNTASIIRIVDVIE